MAKLVPMEKNPFSWISAATALATFLAGFGAKWWAEIVQHRHITERERGARREARRDLLLQRRHDFQRQTLLDLQSTCVKLVRTAGQTNHHDTMECRSKGKWVRGLLPEDVSDESLLAQQQLSILRVRSRDQKVRDLAAKIKEFAAEVSVAETKAASDNALRLAFESHMALNERIGELLREMEDEEIAATGP